MKRVFMLLMCLFAMMAASQRAKAQEITIYLMPGWNWISYTNAVSMDIGEALGDFVPMEGDNIKSKYAQASYRNGSWRGTLHQFTPGLGYHYYSNRVETTSFVFTQAPSSFVTTAEPTDITTTSAVVGGTVTVPESCHVFQRGICWGTEPNPDIDGSHTSNGMDIGAFFDTLTHLNPNALYYVRTYVVTDYGLAYGEQKSFTMLDCEYVDLGLPSGTLWATCNVGATTPEESGDYFAWGETHPKDIYYWSTYLYCEGGAGWNTITKYCDDPEYGYNGFTDNLTTLLPEDDAATANWGEQWRMPTKIEWDELLNNTIFTWTTQNGVNGRLFTAANGNSLFLPAAGSRSGAGLYDPNCGHYWSSSLRTSEGAWRFFFASGTYYMEEKARYFGCTVRPVRSTNNAPTGAVNGKFTINANGDQVYFSQGNLQYQASTNTWRFAENQWDYVGNSYNGTVYEGEIKCNNGLISESYTGWIDLFGWGTSGWDNGNAYYQPYDIERFPVNGDGYGPTNGYNYNYDLTGIYANADWGVYNAISNGGNMPNQWYTLTSSGWNYIINNRSTPSGIRYSKAKVNGVDGLIILPDNWDTSVYTLNCPNQADITCSTNEIDLSDWEIMQANGAVFLPNAGIRQQTSVYFTNACGSYWSSTHYGESEARFFQSSNPSSPGGTSSEYRYYGLSVRLVRNVE